MTMLPHPRGRGKPPARYASIIMPLVLSILMTFVVSAISTLKSLGFTSAFLTTWPAAWAIRGLSPFQYCWPCSRCCGGSWLCWLRRWLADNSQEGGCAPPFRFPIL